MKLTKPQLLVMKRAIAGLSLDGDLYSAAKGSQAATAGRYSVIWALKREGLIDELGLPTKAGVDAVSSAANRSRS